MVETFGGMNSLREWMIRFANGMDSCGILDEWMNGTKKTGAENPMGDEVLDLPAIAMLRHLQAGRNKNLNRGFRKLRVWREAVDLYGFEKKVLGEVKGIAIQDSRSGFGF